MGFPDNLHTNARGGLKIRKARLWPHLLPTKPHQHNRQKPFGLQKWPTDKKTSYYPLHPETRAVPILEDPNQTFPGETDSPPIQCSWLPFQRNRTETLAVPKPLRQSD